MTDPSTNHLSVFLDALRRTQLLDAAQLDAVLARPDASGDDPKPLAKYLLHAGMLTRHQLTNLAAGRDRELVLGPYRLLEPVGQTDLGATYRAVNPSTGRVVAVKRLAPGTTANPDTIRQFQTELDAAHPPPLVDADHAGGRHYIAIDYFPPHAMRPAETQVHIAQFDAADDEEPINDLADLTAGPSSRQIRRRPAKGGSKAFGLLAGASMHIAAIALLVLFLGGYFAFRPAQRPAEKADARDVVLVPAKPTPPSEPKPVEPSPPPVSNLPALNFAAVAIARPEPADAPVKVSPLLKPFDGGHTAAATVATLPDGTSVISAGRDNQLILWDAESGAKVRTVPTPHKVGTLVLNAAGTVAATAGDDTTVRFWSLPDLRETAVLDTLNGQPTALAFSPNGRYLLVACDNWSVKLWDLEERKPVRDLRPATSVAALAISPDGHKAALGTEGGPVLQYDLESARQINLFGGSVGAIRGVAYSPDGTVLACVGDDRSLRFWDTAGVRKQSLRLQLRQPLKGISFAGDGTWAVVCGEGSVFVASPNGGFGAIDINEPAKLASAVPSTDGSAVYLTNVRGGVRLLSFSGGTTEQTLLPASPVGTRAKAPNPKAKPKAKGKNRPTPVVVAPEEAPAMSAGAKLKWESDAVIPQHHVAFSRDGKVLLAVGGDKAVRIYEAASSKERAIVPGVANAATGACLFSDGSGFVASGNAPTLIRTVTVPADCLVRRFSLDGRPMQIVCALAPYLSFEVGALAVTANGQWVLTGGPDYTLRVWSAQGGTVRPAKQYITSGRILAVDAHPKQEVFAALCADGNVAFYRGSLVIKQFSAGTGTPSTMKFSPDGRLVLVCGSEGVTAWDWNAGTIAKQFKRPGIGQNAGCWAAGGAAVVSVGEARAVAYDFDTGRELVSVPTPSGTSHQVAVSPDGKLIAVSGRGVQVYELDKPLVAATAHPPGP